MEVGGARERWPSQQCQNSTGGEVRQRAAAEREREKIVKAEAFAGKVRPRKPTNMRARIDGREARCIELSLSSILRAGLRTKGMRLSRYVFLGALIKRQPLYGRGRALARCVGGVRLIYSLAIQSGRTQNGRERSVSARLSSLEATLPRRLGHSLQQHPPVAAMSVIVVHAKCERLGDE